MLDCRQAAQAPPPGGVYPLPRASGQRDGSLAPGPATLCMNYEVSLWHFVREAQTVSYTAKSWLPARTIVEDSLTKATEVHLSGEIVVLSQFCPVSPCASARERTTRRRARSCEGILSRPSPVTLRPLFHACPKGTALKRCCPLPMPCRLLRFCEWCSGNSTWRSWRRRCRFLWRGCRNTFCTRFAHSPAMYIYYCTARCGPKRALHR